MKTITLCVMLLGLAIVSQAQPFPHVIWDKSGAGDSSGYAKVFALGDQNNDGYADWGVLGYGTNPGTPSESVVELFHGGNPPSTIPYMTFRADPAAMYHLSYADAIGDINGDGFIDWMVWFRYLNSINTYSVQIYYGGRVSDSIPDITMHSRVGAISGESIEGMGDFNADSYGDLYRYDFANDVGWIYFGSAQFDTLWDWRMISPTEFPYLAQPQAFGDVNGDRVTDMIPYNNTPGLHVFLGSHIPDTIPDILVSGLGGGNKSIINDLDRNGRNEIMFSRGATIDIHRGGDIINYSPDFVLNSPCAEEPYLFSVGDINQDGYNDFVAISSWCAGSWWGTLSLYLGHPWLNPNSTTTIRGRTSPLNLIGILSANGLGDINGDVIDDWAICAYNNDADGMRGRVVIISGDTTLRADAIETMTLVPKEIGVSVFPNPFNSSTIIKLNLPVYFRNVDIVVNNVLGQEVDCTPFFGHGIQVD